MLDRRVERGVGIVGRALMPEGDVRLAGEPLAERAGDAGLADPGLAREQHHLALAVAGLLPTVEQECDLLLAPNQRKEAARARLEAAADPALAEHAPRPDHLGKALDRLRPEILELEAGADQPPRRRGDQDGARRSRGLQAGGQVGGLPSDRLLARRVLANKAADYDQLGGDPDARCQRLTDWRRQATDGTDGRQPG